KKRPRRLAPAWPSPYRGGSGNSRLPAVLEELLVLSRALERGRGCMLALDGLRDRIEVAGAHLALVLHRGEALVGRGELGLLQLHERLHVLARVAVGQIEH